MVELGAEGVLPRAMTVAPEEQEACWASQAGAEGQAVHCEKRTGARSVRSDVKGGKLG